MLRPPQPADLEALDLFLRNVPARATSKRSSQVVAFTLTVRLHNPPKPQLSSDNLFDQRSEISPAHAIPRPKELVVVYFLICLSVDYKPMLSSYAYPNNLKFVHACLN